MKALQQNCISLAFKCLEFILKSDNRLKQEKKTFCTDFSFVNFKKFLTIKTEATMNHEARGKKYA